MILKAKKVLLLKALVKHISQTSNPGDLSLMNKMLVKLIAANLRINFARNILLIHFKAVLEDKSQN